MKHNLFDIDACLSVKMMMLSERSRKWRTHTQTNISTTVPSAHVLRVNDTVEYGLDDPQGDSQS